MNLEELYLTKKQREQTGVLFLAMLRRREVQLTILNTHKKGLADGFTSMSKSEKEAVLHKIQMKEARARPVAHLGKPEFLFETLYSSQNAGLLDRATKHMARLPERWPGGWNHCWSCSKLNSAQLQGQEAV